MVLLQVKLYAKYAPRKLIDFLRASPYYMSRRETSYDSPSE